MRIGPWKFHFSTKENYYANVVPLTMPKLYNLRADPFESYDSLDAQGHLLQKMSWLLAPASEIMAQHIKSLVQYPPVQGGTTFDMSNVVADTIKKGQP